MEIKPFGNKALLLQLEARIDTETHNKVKHLNDQISQLPETEYCIPAYCSLTVVYKSELTDYENFAAKIRKMDLQAAVESPAANSYKIPVCYEEEFAPDLWEVVELTGLTPQEIIKKHSTPVYAVYMIGFIPGFPYLGGLADQLHCRRKAEPRKKVEAGSVGLAGSQTGIYPADAPGGWQIIGNTPVPIFMPDKTNPFWFKMGDNVSFYPISKIEYSSLREQFKQGTINKSNFHV